MGKKTIFSDVQYEMGTKSIISDVQYEMGTKSIISDVKYENGHLGQCGTGRVGIAVV